MQFMMSTPSPVSRSPNAPPPPPPPLPSPPSVRGKIPLGKRTAASDGISEPEKVRLVGLHKALRCEIMLEDIIRIPPPDVSNAILTLNTRALSYRQICLLLQFFPTEEEMETLKNYNGDKEQLGKCEQLFLELMKVPHVESKLKLFAFIIEMSSQVEELRHALIALINAAKQLKKSSKSRQVMEIILASVNVSGSTEKLNPSSLLDLLLSRLFNKQMSLIPSLCKLLEEKRPDLLDFAKDLPHLDKVLEISLESVDIGMRVLSIDRKLVEEDLTASQNEPSFQEVLKKFLTITKNDFPILVSLKEELEANTKELSECYGYPAHVPLKHVAWILGDLRNEINKVRYEKACEAEKAKKKQGVIY